MQHRDHERRRAAKVARLLGASPELGTVLLQVFVPDVDRQGRPLTGTDWVLESLKVFGRLFGGATANPKGQGVWRDDGAGGKLVFGRTTIVFSYAREKDVTDWALAELGRFLCRMGREGRQGEIGFVFDRGYMGLKDFGGSE